MQIICRLPFIKREPIFSEGYADDYPEELQIQGVAVCVMHKLGKMQQNKDRFIGAIRRFMEMQKLTAPLLWELIDEITVNETEGVGKNRSQRIMINYKFIGYIEIPECGSNY